MWNQPQNLEDCLNYSQNSGNTIIEENSELKELESAFTSYLNNNHKFKKANINNKTDKKRQHDYIYNMQNKFLSMINSHGNCLWQNNIKNKICYRVNYYEKIQEGSKKAISILLSNKYNKRIKIVDEINFDRVVDNVIYIFTNSLFMIQDNKFNPHCPHEFFLEMDTYYRNLFNYTSLLKKRLPMNLEINNPLSSDFFTFGKEMKYSVDNSGILNTLSTSGMQIANDVLTFKEPILKKNKEENNNLKKSRHTINNFILLLVDKDIHKYNYIMNWLAFFFKNLNKSKIALVLIGDDKTLQDIFWNKIISPIFGSKFCLKVNDEVLKDKSNKELIENKIFVNFNTFSSKYNNRIEKLLEKTLLDDFLDQQEETRIYTQTLVTSTNPFEFVKNYYSVCTVIKTDSLENITRNLYLTDRSNLIKMIQNDLNSFCDLLAQYPINYDFANYALNTKERDFLRETNNKSLIVDSSLSYKINEFLNAIKTLNITYFKKVKEVSLEIYDELEDSFSKEMIPSTRLNLYFNTVYGEEIFTKKRKILDILKNKEELFNQKINTEKNDNGKVLFQGNPTSKLNQKQFRIKNYTPKTKCS